MYKVYRVSVLCYRSTNYYHRMYVIINFTNIPTEYGYQASDHNKKI